MNSNFKIFYALIFRDTKILLKNLKDNIINSAIWVIFEVLILLHLFPILGFEERVTIPILIGSILFTLPNSGINRGIEDVYDLSNSRVVDFYKSLPISINWFIAKYIVSYGMFFLFYTVPTFILVKIFAGKALDLSKMRVFDFLTVYFLGILFFSMTFLILVFWWSKEDYLAKVWPRFTMPVMFLAPTFFALQHALEVSHKLGGLLLLNPVTYFLEGIRIAVLGGPHPLSITLCAGVLFSLVIIMYFIVCKLIIKRLDLVR